MLCTLSSLWKQNLQSEIKYLVENVVIYYYYIIMAQMIFEDPFHPKPFCDFVTLWNTKASQKQFSRQITSQLLHNLDLKFKKKVID